MKITTDKHDTTLKLCLEGRVDTSTAPQLEEELQKSISDVTELILDFEKVEYISSAGLRVLLASQKIMNKQGKMYVTNISKPVLEVFEMTGFSEILTIQ